MYILKHLYFLQIAALISLFIIGHLNAETWNNGFKKGDTVPEDAFQKDKHFVKTVFKRSSDWSSRRPASSVEYKLDALESVSSVEYKLDAQESDNVDTTTKLPKIIRKVRFQNVPQQIRHFEKNGNNVEKYGNDTITSDKQGRVVRIRKFRKRKTTQSPTVTTTAYSTTTTIKPATVRSIAQKLVQHYRNPNSITTSTAIPLLFKSVTPQMTQYAHITVINKEIIDQKPNRKQKNKKQARIPFGVNPIEDNNPYKNEHDLTVQSTDRTYNSVPNKSRGYRSSEDLKNSNSSQGQDYKKSTKKEEGTEKLNTKRHDAKVLPTSSGIKENVEKIRSKNNRPNLRNPSREVQRLKPQLPKTAAKVSVTTTASPIPKSVEILSDSAPTHPNATSQDITNQKQNDNNGDGVSVTTLSPFLADTIPMTLSPETERDFIPMIPNNGFRRFPQHGFQGYPYEPLNPFFRPPGGQVPLRMQQPQNGGNLAPLSFQQPFPQFYRQNEPQFHGYYAAPQQVPPYHRSGSLGTPGFYHSPQLESLRRSIIDTYAEEESIESTTEYSLPKFEIPSIDFNDKGCRTVYKEVSALPADGLNRRSTENRAKSFVMTRECFFPEGVPTTRTVDANENIYITTPSTKDI